MNLNKQEIQDKFIKTNYIKPGFNMVLSICLEE